MKKKYVQFTNALARANPSVGARSAAGAVNDVRFTNVNVERIKGALASTIHEMPLGLTREERRAFILAAAKSAG